MLFKIFSFILLMNFCLDSCYGYTKIDLLKRGGISEITDSTK